eukprot:1418094-Prorocentrum_lima.AAC.1
MCIRDRFKPKILASLRVRTRADLPPLLRAADPSGRFQMGTIGFCRAPRGGGPVAGHGAAAAGETPSMRYWGPEVPITARHEP